MSRVALRAVQRIEVEARRACVEQPGAELGGDVDPDPLRLLDIVTGFADALDEPRRHGRTRHPGHAADLRDVGDRHDAGEHRFVDAQRRQIVDQREVVVDLEEELRDGEVGTAQLRREVLAIGVAIGGPWVQLGVSGDADRERAVGGHVLDELARMPVVTRSRLIAGGRISSEGEDVLDVLGEVVDEDLVDVPTGVALAGEMGHRGDRGLASHP